MITEKDLQEAIAECQGQRNPNANTCIKLAAFLTIQRELYGEPETRQIVSYSYADEPLEGDLIQYEGDCEALRIMNGQNVKDMIPLLDELFSTLQIVNKRLYDGFIRRLKDKAAF